MPRAQLKFWGVRGSTPTPVISNLKCGGNTSCVEVRTSTGESVIFDAGSGIRNLGQQLLQEAAGAPIDVKIFLTHFHWDHIQGIPFFAPLYGPKNRVAFHSSKKALPLIETLEGQMAQPYFPVSFSQVSSKRDFNEIEENEVVTVGNLKIHAFPLHHPQGAAGYRIEADGAVIVYATDYEHGNENLDATLRDYAAGADILICDSQYTPAEYETHRGWGHSTWENATRVAKDAGAKQLVLFHHDPEHDDDTMYNIAWDASRVWENTIAAYEGCSIDL